MTLNHKKTVFSTTELSVLGYKVSEGLIRPDPERMRPLEEMPPPTSKKGLLRVLGMFAYYAKWIPKFSEEAYDLYKAT